MSSADAASEEKKMILLMSSDGEKFEVEEAVALQSQTIKHMIEDDCAGTTIPLPNVTSTILVEVIKYCQRHVDAPAKASGDGTSSNTVVDEGFEKFEKEFVEGLDQGTLFDLILAANYLNIEKLLDLTCQTVADMIKGKNPEQVRETLNIKNDFTKEEEDEIRKENAWAFE